ncbi:MAG TPA: class I SAM-dependent methyltransferase [Candidatus Omnitrophota bacterium]|nr:class I SAM-dependent methyltransferase [Candidatus Omnitrophota bacterium]
MAALDNCYLCGKSKNPKLLYNLTFGSVYSCLDCKIAYTVFNQGYDRKEPNLVFGLKDFIKARIYDQRRLHKIARDRLRLLKRFLPSGRILELGSSTGEFVYTCAKNGYEVTYADLCPSLLNINITGNLKEQIKLETGLFKNGKTYDAIAAFHTLEHLTDAARFLLNCYEALNSNKGILFLEVPNFGSLLRRIMGKSWFYDYHASHFDKASLERLLRASGYEILLVRTVEEPERYLALVYNPLRNLLWSVFKKIPQIKNNSSSYDNCKDKFSGYSLKEENIILNSYKARLYRLESFLLGLSARVLFPFYKIIDKFYLGANLQIVARKSNAKA